MEPKKLILGLAIVIGIALTWVGATEYAQEAQSTDSFHAPFFLNWFSAVFSLLLFIPNAVTAWRKNKTDKDNIHGIKSGGSSSSGSSSRNGHVQAKGVVHPQASASDALDDPRVTLLTPSQAHGHHEKGEERERESITVWQDSTLATRCGIVLGFYVLFVGANYSYVRALSFISASIVTALFSTAPVFVFVFSLCLLGQRATWLRLGSVVLAVGGISLVVSPWSTSGDKGDPTSLFLGQGLAVLAAVCAGLYKVMFKRVFHEPSSTFVALFLAIIGVVQLFLGGIIVIILDRTGAEPVFGQVIPWSEVVISSALGLAFNFLINFGISVTHPLFISIGTVLGIPVAAVVDYLARDTALGSTAIIGICLIILGFLALLYSEYRDSSQEVSKDPLLRESHVRPVQDREASGIK